MGFNRRKMEAERKVKADAEAAAKRATDAQVLADAEALIAAWNERQRKAMPMLFAPTIGAAIAATQLVSVGALSRVSYDQCDCLRTLDRHRDAAVTSLIPWLWSRMPAKRAVCRIGAPVY
jgi:hypothetical protein